MKWKSLPPATPAVLLRHPVLLAEWLQLVNRLRRCARAGSLPLVSIAILAGVSLAVALLRIFSSQLVDAIDTIVDYWVLAMALAALYAATSIAKRRQHLRDSHLQSWLIATPMPLASIRLSNSIRGVLPLLTQFFVIALLILLSQTLGEGTNAASGTAIGALGGGMLLGGLVGWFANNDRPTRQLEESRYAGRSKAHAELRPDSSALAGWPIAQVRAWSRPENSRYLLLAALLAVQGGSSAVTGLSVVAMYLLGGYLTALLSAVLKVAKAAAQWLRSTPMTLHDFAWALLRRVLLHQVLGTVLAAAFMLLLGAPLSLALQAASLWLLLVMSVSGWALLDGYRGRSPTLNIAVSLAVSAALAAAWQCRGAKG